MISPGFDLIGDIHGNADPLKLLLHRLGYEKQSGRFIHPEGRKVIFLGDYVDRGPKIRESLQIVRGMTEVGSAIALMGNHEFNALTYHTLDGKGGFLRPHSPEKVHQHEATLHQLAAPFPREWAVWLEWFRTLPMFLDMPELRAVHATWSSSAVELLRPVKRLDIAILQAMTRSGDPLQKAKEILLNGEEFLLPAGGLFADKAGVKRGHIRVRWWADLQGKTYRDAVFPDSEMVAREPIPAKICENHLPYPENAPPVFFGHYWMRPDAPKKSLAPNVACLDFSAAKGGPMVAYRWNGEQVLAPEKFMVA